MLSFLEPILVAGVLLASCIAISVQAQPLDGNAAAKPGTIGIENLEEIAQQQGIRVREMKVRDLLLKVEGVDAQGRKVELILDRRTGEVMSRRLDD